MDAIPKLRPECLDCRHGCLLDPVAGPLRETGMNPLWTRNFLMAFGFYLLMPTLPM